MATIVTRAGKGSPLTNTELDANFTNLNTEVTVDSYPTTRPSLMLDFVNNTALDSRVTFTRASSATYINKIGNLQTAAINEPRFEYDSVTRLPRGLLIEEARTNLVTYSDQFDNASWLKSSASITQDTVISPDGTQNADYLIEASAASVHYTSQNIIISPGATYSFSIIAKAAGRSILQLGFDDGTNNGINASFDLTTGTVAASVVARGTGTAVSSSITAFNNGWYRCSIVGTAGAVATTSRVSVVLSNGSTTWAPSYTGDGISGVYIYGAQLELGIFTTSYIPTTTIALTRAADLASVNTLSPWYNAVEGTLFAETQLLGFSSVTNPNVVALYGAIPANDSINVFIAGGSPNYRSNITTSGTNQLLQNVVGNPNMLDVNKWAIAFKTNDSVSIGRLVPAVDTSVTLPTITQLNFGSTSSIALYIRRIMFYPRRLISTELQAVIT